MSALIALLISVFGPILGEWLKKLLERLLPELPAAVTGEPVVAIHDVFAAAREKLTFLDRLRGRVLALRAAERIAVNRADEFHAAAVAGGPKPVLTTGERRALMGG